MFLTKDSNFVPGPNVHYYMHAPHALQQNKCECGEVVLTMLEAVSESPD